MPGQSPDSRHALSAVDESQTFFGQQVIGGQACLLHSLGPGHPLSFIKSFSAAQQHQSHMCQRGKVAAGTQGTLLGDHRVYSCVEHIDQALDQFPANTGKAF